MLNIDKLKRMIWNEATSFLGEGHIEDIYVERTCGMPADDSTSGCGYIVDIVGIYDYRYATALDFILYLLAQVFPFYSVSEEIDRGYFSIYIDDLWISGTMLDESFRRRRSRRFNERFDNKHIEKYHDHDNNEYFDRSLCRAYEKKHDHLGYKNIYNSFYDDRFYTEDDMKKNAIMDRDLQRDFKYNNRYYDMDPDQALQIAESLCRRRKRR